MIISYPLKNYNLALNSLHMSSWAASFGMCYIFSHTYYWLDTQNFLSSDYKAEIQRFQKLRDRLHSVVQIKPSELGLFLSQPNHTTFSSREMD